MQKKVAVFIPCYNASRTVEATLHAVANAVQQTKRHIPVYLYDDCSKDNSTGIASQCWQYDLPFTVVKNEQNCGERTTTNRAFNFFFKEKYDWVFIIHADDLPKIDWLTTMLGCIDELETDNYFTVWSSFDSFNDQTGQVFLGDDSGKQNRAERDFDAIKYYLTKVYSSWHISGAALNVACYQALQGFEEGMPQFGDTDFFVRGLLAGYRDVYIQRTLTSYRITATSVSSVSFRTNRDLKEIKYMLGKYDHLLNKADRKKLYRIINTTSRRRMVKWLLRVKPALFFLNLRQFSDSSIQLIRLSVG